ncbi:hypothetical protein [Streptomyces sp. NPDC002851]
MPDFELHLGPDREKAVRAIAEAQGTTPEEVVRRAVLEVLAEAQAAPAAPDDSQRPADPV